jgi:hypothetical protein
MTVVPTLHHSPINLLTSIEDKIASLIQFMLFNPGMTSSLVEPLMLSYRKMEGENAGDIETLCKEMSTKLTLAIQRIAPGQEIRAEVSAVNNLENEPETLHRLSIKIIDRNGITLIPLTHVTVDENGFLKLTTIRSNEHD